jgi:hypothetical protein
MIDSPDIWTSRFREFTLCGLIGFCIAIAFFVPVWSELSNGAHGLAAIYEIFFHTSNPEPLFGKGVDQYGSFWMVHEVSQMLFANQDTVLNDVYAPFGYDLGIHTGFAWADTLIGVPLLKWIGVPGFYNLYVLSSIWLSACAIIALFRVIGAPWIVVIALTQLLFFQEFVIEEVTLGRPTQINLIFPAIFWIGIWKNIHDSANNYAGILMGIGLAGSCLVYWFGGVSMGFIGAIIGLIAIAKSSNRVQKIKQALIGILGGCLAIALVSWRGIKPIISGKGSKAYLHKKLDPIDTLDVFSFEMPIYKIRSFNTMPAIDSVWDDTELSWVIVGAWILMLCMVPLWKKHNEWLIGTIIAVGFPFGFALGVTDSDWIPTSLILLQGIFPPIIRCQFVERLQFSYTIPALILLSIFFLQVLKIHGNTVKLYSVSILLILINLGNFPFNQSILSDSFEVYDDTSQFFENKKGGVLEVPLSATDYTYVQQIWHKRPINGGPGLDTVREPRHTRYFSRNQITSALEAIATKTFTRQTLERRSLLQLHRDHFKWVVVHMTQQDGQLADYEHFLQTKGTLLDDGQIAVFPLPTISIVPSN